MLTHCEDTKGNAKFRNWGGLGWLGSSKVIGNQPFDRAQMTSYATLIETVRLSCAVFDNELSQSPNLTYPFEFGPQFRLIGLCRSNFAETFRVALFK